MGILSIEVYKTKEKTMLLILAEFVVYYYYFLVMCIK